MDFKAAESDERSDLIRTMAYLKALVRRYRDGEITAERLAEWVAEEMDKIV